MYFHKLTNLGCFYASIVILSILNLLVAIKESMHFFFLMKLYKRAYTEKQKFHVFSLETISSFKLNTHTA